MATPSLEGQPNRTNPSPIIPYGNRTTSRKLIQIARSNFPSGLRLSAQDCETLLFIEKNPGLAYKMWPADYQSYQLVAKLRKRGWVKRSYWPTRFAVTRTGFNIVKWIAAAIEHGTPPTRAAKA